MPRYGVIGRIRVATTLEEANRFLRERYIAEFNGRFQVAAAERGSAFVPVSIHDLHRVFSLQFERTVNRDNTVRFENLSLHIEAVKWRGTLARLLSLHINTWMEL
jgi:ribosomal 30S subunit maturation factor RimM